MTDRRTCVRCGRAIDSFARICPFCNWDQNDPTPPRKAAAPPQEHPYTPPADHSGRKYVLGGIGALLLVIAMFAIGAYLHRRNPAATVKASKAPAATTTGLVSPPRADVTLVPDNGPLTTSDPPITSAPAPQQAQGIPTEYQRSDATAVSSVEYTQMASRAEAEHRKPAMIVDPRTVALAPPRTAATKREARDTLDQQQPPVSMTSAAPQAQAAQAVVVRTRPVPEYQPLPDIHVKRSVTAVLDLVIGADGHVREVSVRTPVPGESGKLVAAVQRWRFKPATENGVPVQSPFSVDISFNADE